MATFKEYILSDSFKSLSELYISAAKNNATDRKKSELKESLFSFLLSTGHKQREKGTATDGEYEREPIIAELIHEALCHATIKGLNQTDTILLVQSLLEGLEWIKNKDEFCELEEDLKSLLQSLSASFTTLHGQQVTTQYLIQTLLLQPNLYHYLMNEEQERDMTYLELTLYSSSLLPPLSEGTIEEEWHRKERVACVDAQYELQKNQLVSEKESSLSEEKDKLGKLYGDLNDSFEDEEKVDQEELKTVLGPLVLGHVSGMKTELLLKLKEQEMNIAHKIDRMKAWKGEKRTTTTPDKQQ